MKISLCVGKYATNAYCITELKLKVYSIEELCYVIKENAFLLDMSFMNFELVSWIQNECGLLDLATELAPLVRKKGSLSAFVTIIMEYVNLFDRETIKSVEKVLRNGSGLSSLEKRKQQTDYLVEKKKFMAAIRAYSMLIEDWEMEKDIDLNPSVKVKADLWHNMGVAFVGLFEYLNAAECFYQSYILTESYASYNAFLAAKRMGLGDLEYIDFISTQPNSYTPSLELEGRMKLLNEEFNQHESKKMLNDLFACKLTGDKQKYYDSIEQLTYSLKEEYRSSVAE